MAAVERDPQSTQQSALEQKAAEAKAFVRDEAKNPPNEQDFKQKMQKALNDAKNKVQVLQREVRRTAATERAKRQKEEKQADLFGNLTQFLEALRIGTMHKDYKQTFQELGISDEKAGNLILKIYEKLPTAISPNSVLPLTTFIFEVAKKRPKKTDIKREWDKLKKEIETDLPLLRGLRDALVEAVRSTNIEGFANEEEARTDFNVPNDNIVSFKSAGNLSEADRAELSRIERGIEAFLSTLDEGSRAEMRQLLKYARDNQDVDAVFSQIPQAFNNNLEDANLYISLSQQKNRSGASLLKSLVINYGLSPQDVDPISLDFIHRNIARAREEVHGHVEFSTDLKEQMKTTVFRVVNAVIARATDNLNEHYQLSGQESNTLRYLQQALTSLLGDPLLRRRFREVDPADGSEMLYKDFIKFVKELNIFIDEENARRSYAHNMMNELVVGKASLASMKENAAKMNISNVNNILAGYQGSIVDMAAHLIPQYIQHRTAIKNKNEYAADLWAMKRNNLGEQFFPDFDGIRKALRESIIQVAYDMADNPNANPKQRKEFMDAVFVEEDKTEANKHNGIRRVNDTALTAAVERAMALGMHLAFATMRAPVEASLVKTPQAFLPTPFYENFNIRLQYGIMKAHDIKKGSDSQLDYIPELRTDAFRVRTADNTGTLWERISNGEAKTPWGAVRKHKGWVPGKLYKAVDTTRRMSAKALVDRLKMEVPDPDFATYDDEITFKETYGDLSHYDIFSVGGGRIGGMKNWVNTEMAKPPYNLNSSNWEDKYKFIRENVGAGALWMWDPNRADDEVKPLAIAKYQELAKAGDPAIEKVKIPYKDSYTAREQEKIYDEFKLEVGALASVKLENGMTAKKSIESRTQYLRSQNFLSLLERSPENFLYTMARLEPELAQTVQSKNGGTLSAYDFYFNDDKLSLLGEEDLIKRRAQRNVWKGRWTDSKSYLGEADDKDFKNYYNFDQLKEVAFLWHRYYMQEAVDKDGKLNGEGIAKAQDKFFDRMSAATRRVMMRNGSVMTKEDIIKKGEEDDKEGRLLAELFLNDQNGFIKKMQGLKENFGDAKSPGEKKFFYWMANRWFNHDFRGGVIPTENDIKMSPMTARATETWSETLFADGYGRATAWNENAVKALADIDNVLLKAATEKNISGIIQIHEKVHTLRGMVGIDVSKFHYFIATAVIRFYQRDYRLRAPWPFNWWLYSFRIEKFNPSIKDIDKDMSLSTRYKSYGAMQFTEENIREYGTYLSKRGFLKAYGDWSRDMLWKNLGADREKYLKLQAGPTIFFMSTAMTMGDLFMSAVNEFAGDLAGTKS